MSVVGIHENHREAAWKQNPGLLDSTKEDFELYVTAVAKYDSFEQRFNASAVMSRRHPDSLRCAEPVSVRFAASYAHHKHSGPVR
jgi:Ni,Fe-hydrogenase III large subunit